VLFRSDMASVSQSPICGIYKITNLVNGMCYVGQSRDINKRWIDHRRKSPNLSNMYLHRAIRKYGLDKFKFEVIQECEISQLNDLERKYIAVLNTQKPYGYNLESGGGAGKEVSQETIDKLRSATLGANNPNYGKPKSDTTKRKLALSHSPSVNQYSMDGKYLRTFATTVEALEFLGIANNYGDRHKICACCRGDRGATLGFQWRSASAGSGDIKPYREHIGNSIAVSKFTPDGIFIETFQSAQEAAESVNRTNANILYACKTGGKSGGFVWRYS
jgi:group I intron endonuclease